MVDTEKKVELIPYERTLAALEGVKRYEKAPFTGYATEVKIHWPDGCDHLVDVAISNDRTLFCPREGFLALNDTTVTYPFGRSVKVEEGNELGVEMRNGDGANPHAITVTIRVEEE